MALKALMIRKQMDQRKKSLQSKQDELEKLKEQESELIEREKELEQAIDEAETAEEQDTVEEAVRSFDSEKVEHSEKKGNLEREIQELEDEIQKLEGELDAEEAEQDTEPEAAEEEQPEEKQERSKEIKTMENRTKFFGMSMAERDNFIARDDVQKMLSTVREAIKEKRAISGAGYLVPTVVLGLIRENVIEYSKLYKHVYVRRVAGEGRMVIQGQIPEAVWTEACATLNELDLSFSQVEVDGYKVGGYFRMCNAMLEDSDIDLAAELISVLGQAIGYALDKAILYGTGTKMPSGIVHALAAVEQTPNIKTIAAGTTGLALWQEFITDAGLAKSTYSRGAKVWTMNETTYTNLIAQSVSVDAGGAIVAGVNGTMPAIGGVIEVLNFIPDNVIVGGYFDLYLLAERAGTRISTSEHAFWVEDQTGFKGTARYDGKVLDPSAFVAVGLNGVTPTAAMTFAQDTANSEDDETT